MLQQFRIPYVYTVESSIGVYFLQLGIGKVQNMYFDRPAW